jgi:hypothetical protein
MSLRGTYNQPRILAIPALKNWNKRLYNSSKYKHEPQFSIDSAETKLYVGRINEYVAELARAVQNELGGMFLQQVSSASKKHNAVIGANGNDTTPTLKSSL